MQELTYYVACSVDGFIARPDGGCEGFATDAEYLTDLFARFPETCPAHFRRAMGVENVQNRCFDTVLMGRKTYEVGLKAGIANPYPHLKQYVFSRSLKTSPDENVERVAQNARERVRSLKNESGKGIWLCGGGNLATALFEAALIDRVILKINPLFLGAGIPLFSGTIPPTALERTDSQLYPNGVSLLHFRVGARCE